MGRKKKPGPKKKYRKKKKKIVGRPNKRSEAKRVEIMKLAREGKTNKEISETVGISEKTFYTWKSDNKEFLHALNKNKEQADKNVEASLYQRATGYNIEEEKIHFDKDGNVNRATTHRHFAPDTTAGIFWLCNRKRKDWKQRNDIELGEETRRDFILSYDLTDPGEDESH